MPRVDPRATDNCLEVQAPSSSRRTNGRGCRQGAGLHEGQRLLKRLEHAVAVGLEVGRVGLAFRPCGVDARLQDASREEKARGRAEAATRSN